MRISTGVAIIVGATLSGCTTLSFAPPKVVTEFAMQKVDEEGTCAVTGSANPITPDVSGALQLEDNFLAGYRCAARQASDGRQSFEIPSFLALVAAGVGGPLYGLSRNEVLAAGAYSGVMGRANSYYAPKENGNILRGAIDGVLCIKTASVGYDYFKDSPPEAKGAHLAPETSSEERVIAVINEQLAALQAQSKPGISDGEKAHIEARQKELSDLKTDMIKIMAQKDIKASVTIDTSRAYYELVVSALFSVDRVLEKRLSDSGSFEPAGISAELEKYVKQDVKATEDKKGFLGDLQDSNKIRSLTLADAEKQLIDLELDQLQARLQTCVVRAKIS
jgi:hypothetical protein